LNKILAERSSNIIQLIIGNGYAKCYFWNEKGHYISMKLLRSHIKIK